MSFRKRNVVIGTPSGSNAQPTTTRQEKIVPPGVRPSPLDGRPSTSTGTSSLDQILGGHAGLPLGTSLLVEEAGTTDFGGILLRYYAAEGLVQGHDVHLLGLGESWRRELPGLASEGSKSSSRLAKKETSPDDKMKIAWRYETLGNSSNRAPIANKETNIIQVAAQGATFCHNFDLTKRLENSSIKGKLHATPIGEYFAKPPETAFKSFLTDVYSKIVNSPPSSVHRIVIPSFLSPTLYSPAACRPQVALKFLHGLRALLRQFPGQLTAIVTLPSALYPRSAGLVRWMELLFDGVLELIALQHESQMSREPGTDTKAQGLLRVHSLPVFHEKGGGLEGSWSREDLSYKLSASNGMVITPFSLPPVGEEEELKKVEKTADKKKDSLEF